MSISLSYISLNDIAVTHKPTNQFHYFRFRHSLQFISLLVPPHYCYMFLCSLHFFHSRFLHFSHLLFLGVTPRLFFHSSSCFPRLTHSTFPNVSLHRFYALLELSSTPSLPPFPGPRHCDTRPWEGGTDGQVISRGPNLCLMALECDFFTLGPKKDTGDAGAG